MDGRFEDIPHRIFLDSSLLQTLQTYGEVLVENLDLSPDDHIHRDPLCVGSPSQGGTGGIKQP
jgi:hypothetical protein